jgi:hypothetical protein|tara:strand:+ start:303 stop:572 length:270 start_codon:yes stop_codon:yes gene_type:complete
MAEETKDPVATEAPVGGPVPTPQVDAPTAPDLNISDLTAVKSIIEVATQRGAFKAAELEAVGKAFNKLSTFLDHVVSQQQKDQGEANNG